MINTATTIVMMTPHTARHFGKSLSGKHLTQYSLPDGMTILKAHVNDPPST